VHWAPLRGTRAQHVRRSSERWGRTACEVVAEVSCELVEVDACDEAAVDGGDRRGVGPAARALAEGVCAGGLAVVGDPRECRIRRRRRARGTGPGGHVGCEGEGGRCRSGRIRDQSPTGRRRPQEATVPNFPTLSTLSTPPSRFFPAPELSSPRLRQEQHPSVCALCLPLSLNRLQVLSAPVATIDSRARSLRPRRAVACPRPPHQRSGRRRGDTRMSAIARATCACTAVHCAV
jgi:hypothetical protein